MINEEKFKPVMTTDSESNITFNGNTSEMLKIAKDGFYIRGVKVPQDEREAEKVYNTFHQWLTWAVLTRQY
jgi:hydroxyethylthiazole kinase-like sugar kinase family protein